MNKAKKTIYIFQGIGCLTYSSFLECMFIFFFELIMQSELVSDTYFTNKIVYDCHIFVYIYIDVIYFLICVLSYISYRPIKLVARKPRNEFQLADFSGSYAIEYYIPPMNKTTSINSGSNFSDKRF